jgi:hypothetical protein
LLYIDIAEVDDKPANVHLRRLVFFDDTDNLDVVGELICIDSSSRRSVPTA